MSAIFGIIDRRGDSIDPARADGIAAVLAHRGPDGQVRESGPGFMLGHALLDTAGPGPAMGCLLTEGDFVVSADCRIDNRDELCAALAVPVGASDTLMLLRAFQRWGEDFANNLLGDFAVAIWNARDHTLICARDHFGIKPFYYVTDSRYFVFASEPSAVLASGLASPDIADERIADYLAGVAPEIDQTSYREVKRLPLAHYGVCDRGGWRIAAYYTLPKPAVISYADAPAEFRKILTQAVVARLRGGPAGAMLSGGLDSSSIAAIASRQIAGTGTNLLPTFSLVFDETPALNERPYIEAVLEQGGYAPAFIPSNRLAHFAELDQILDEQQDLFLAPNLACSRQIYKQAQAQGVRVLLDGHGGDEVAPVGEGRLHELAARGKWITLWRVLAGAMIYGDERKAPIFWAFIKGYTRLRGLIRLARSARRRLGLAQVKSNPSIDCINPDFAAQTEIAARSRPTRWRQAGQAITDQSFQHEILTGPLQSYAFETLDRIAAAAGIEARYPFWDRRLVEFCLTLDSAEKLNDGWGRLILRRAMEGLIPPSVQWRRQKFDFGRHITTSIVRDHSDLVFQTLDDTQNSLGRYVDLPAARLIMHRLQKSVAKPNGFEMQAIFRIMVLAAWLKRQNYVLPEAALV